MRTEKDNRCVACRKRQRMVDPEAGDTWLYCEQCLSYRVAAMREAGYLQDVEPLPGRTAQMEIA